MTEPIKIELVVADRNWILEEFAVQLIEAAQQHAIRYEVVNTPSQSADIYYFLPYSIFQRIDDAICVSLFTHIEEDYPDAKANFFRIAKESDHCICMSVKYEKWLRDAGIDHVSTITPGVDRQQFYPKLKVGVVGRAYHTGRKNEALVAKLRKLDFLDLRFTGEGWIGRSVYYDKNGLNDFYNSLDYLLVTAKIEGGPMPLLESIAAGTPAVAPDVGFVNDFPHIPYENSSIESLQQVLTDLHKKKCQLTSGIENTTWQEYSERHHNLFSSLFNASRKERLDSEKLDGSRKNAIALITHGSENTTKGGPTQRVLYTKAQLELEGFNVEIAYGEVEIEAPTVHVINSWPLSTALSTVKFYKKMGKRVVFSPIMLDLSFLDEYRSVQSVLGVKGAEEYVANSSAFLKHVKSRGGFPKETVVNHFLSICQCAWQSDTVIALSEFEKENLIRIGVEAAKIIVAKNCSDPFFDYSSTVEQSDHKFLDLEKYLLVVGRVESRKNLLGICEALKSNSTPIVSIGHSAEPEYRSLIESLYPGKVIFLDRVENRELLKIAYSNCLAYVQFSWCEGACLSTLEAYSCGANLIIANMSGEDEYYASSDVHFVNDLDPVALLAAVTEIEKVDKYSSQEVAARRREEVTLRRQAYVRDHIMAYSRSPADRVSEQVFVDLTSYAHFLLNGGNSTGAVTLERKLLLEFKLMAERGENVKFLLWSHRSNSFLIIDEVHCNSAALISLLNLELGRIDEVGFLPSFTNLPSSHNHGDDVKNSSYTEGAIQLVSKLDHATIFNGGASYLAFQIVKTIIRSLPSVISKGIVSAIARVRPDFQLFETLGNRTAGELEAVSRTRGEESKLGDYSNKNVIQRKKRISIEHGAKMISIGNAWMSNENYLNELSEFVRFFDLNHRGIIYDILPITHSHFFPKGTIDRFSDHLEKLSGFTSKLYSISEYTLDALSSYYAMEKDRPQLGRISIGTLYNSSDEISESSNSLTLPAKFILFVSSISERKNHLFLFRVWECLLQKYPNELQTVQLLVVGKSLFQNFDSSKYKNLVWLKDLSDSDLAFVYKQCMFTVYPSVAEGFGLPVQESIELGKPCIASALPSLREINHPSLIKVPGDDFYGWVNAIGTMVLNDRIRNALQDECSSFLPEENWACTVNQLVS